MAAQRALIASLEVGDEVITTGGIYGTDPASSTTTTLDLEIADGVVVKVARGARSSAQRIEPRRAIVTADDDGRPRRTTGRRLIRAPQRLVPRRHARAHRSARSSPRVLRGDTPRARPRPAGWDLGRARAGRRRPASDVARRRRRHHPQPGRRARRRRARDQPPGRQHRHRPPGCEGPRQGPPARRPDRRAAVPTGAGAAPAGSAAEPSTTTTTDHDRHHGAGRTGDAPTAAPTTTDHTRHRRGRGAAIATCDPTRSTCSPAGHRDPEHASAGQAQRLRRPARRARASATVARYLLGPAALTGQGRQRRRRRSSAAGQGWTSST